MAKILALFFSTFGMYTLLRYALDLSISIEDDILFMLELSAFITINVAFVVPWLLKKLKLA